MQSEFIDFRQYLFAIRRRWLPASAIFVTVVTLTVIYTILQKPTYQATGKLLIKRTNNVTSAIKEEDLGQDRLTAIGRQSDPLTTEAELIRSTPIAQKTIAALGLEVMPEAFLKRLSVESIQGSDVLQLTYQGYDPQEAATAVNQVMKLYLESNITDNRTEAAAARKFIIEQLPLTEANLYKAEAFLRKFEEDNNIINLEEEAKSAVKVIEEVEDQANTTSARLADIETQSKALQSKLDMNPEEAVIATSLSQSPGVKRALEELQQVESQLVIEQARFQETHPAVANLKSKKNSLEALLKSRSIQTMATQQQVLPERLQLGDLKQQIAADLVRLEAERLGLQSQASALSNLLSSYKQRTNTLPRLKQRQGELVREVQAAQATYQTLLQRLEEIRVEENRNVGNARLVEGAVVPDSPAAPNKPRNIALGGLLGILLSVGVALVLDALDTSLKTVKEAREVFGYTMLGLIPTFGKLEKARTREQELETIPKIVVRDTPLSPISEAYRMLQANLKFLSSDKQLKVIVVTSAVPQEGKSTVSANLAIAIAQSERRVLLVDADMRQPVQHKIWEMYNEVGLSNVLVGQGELRKAIKEVATNLYVLSAGVNPPNPMNLLDSKRMAGLIDTFSSNYDFVIIDTPALGIAADAPILGKMADGILFVVRPGVVDTAAAAAAKEFLEQSGQNVLGLVVNGVTSENKPYNSYYAKEYYVEENSVIREVVTTKHTGQS